MRVSHPHFRYSCQHKLLWNLQHSFRCTFTGGHNVLLPYQMTEDRVQSYRIIPTFYHSLKHLRNFFVLCTPCAPSTFIDISKIKTISYPDSHFISRTNRYLKITYPFSFRYDLLPNPSAMFAQIDLLAFLICWPSPYCSLLEIQACFMISKEIYMLFETLLNLQMSYIICSSPVLCTLSSESVASVLCLAPVNFRRGIIRPVSYYAFFKGLLLLSQPPGCINNSTSFST